MTRHREELTLLLSLDRPTIETDELEQDVIDAVCEVLIDAGYQASADVIGWVNVIRPGNERKAAS